MQRVVRVLDRIVTTRGYLMKMRMDNVPELISLTLSQWIEEYDVLLEFIKPVKESLPESRSAKVGEDVKL